MQPLPQGLREINCTPSRYRPGMKPMAQVELTSKSIIKYRSLAVANCERQEVHDKKQNNLVLRIQPRGLRWGLRLSVQGADRRVDLGGVDDWSIAEARELGSEAGKMLRNRTGIPDADWVHAKRIEYGKIKAPPVGERSEPVAKTRGWTFTDAKEAYLAEVKRTLRPATHEDYRGMLGVEVLAPLATVPVASIDRQQMSKLVQSVHQSGRERHSEHLASVVRPMWTWLAGDNQIERSGVGQGAMIGLKAPPRSRSEWSEAGYVPPMIELGRIVAIARSGALHSAISDAVQLLAFSAQRRLTVATARTKDFEPVRGGCLWNIPSAFMKSGTKKKTRTVHVVPLTTAQWNLVQRAMENSIDPDSEWLFPQFRPRRAGDQLKHMSASTLTRALLLMNGVEASPHDLRRAFATHGEFILKWKRANSQSILDHGEGEEGSDVTGIHYALHNGTHHKWRTMRKWSEAVEDAVAKAIVSDDRLTDAHWLKAEVDRMRYCDDAD